VSDLPSWEELRALLLAPKPPLTCTVYAIARDPIRLVYDGVWSDEPGWARPAIEPWSLPNLGSADGRVVGRVREHRSAFEAEVDGLRREGGPTMRLLVDEETGCILRTERVNDPAPLLLVEDLRVGTVEHRATPAAPPS